MTETNPGFWEGIIYSWYVVEEIVEQIGPRQFWQAKLTALVEPFLSTEPVVISPLFNDPFKASKWSYHEVLERWGRVCWEWRMQPSPDAQELHDYMLNLFLQFEVSTSRGIGISTLKFWGEEIMLLDQNLGKLSELASTEIEPMWFFLELDKYLPSNRSSFEPLPAQTAELSIEQIYIKSRRWARELAKMPLYPTLNIYQQVINEWFERANLEEYKDVTNLDLMRGFYQEIGYMVQAL